MYWNYQRVMVELKHNFHWCSCTSLKHYYKYWIAGQCNGFFYWYSVLLPWPFHHQCFNTFKPIVFSEKGNSSPYILVNHVSINFTVQPNFDISARVSEHFLHHRPSHCNGINLLSVFGQLLAWVLEKYSPRMLVLFNLYDCKLRSFSQKKTQKTYYALKLCSRCLSIF